MPRPGMQKHMALPGAVAAALLSSLLTLPQLSALGLVLILSASAYFFVRVAKPPPVHTVESDDAAAPTAPIKRRNVRFEVEDVPRKVTTAPQWQARDDRIGYLYHADGVVGTVLDDVVIQAAIPDAYNSDDSDPERHTDRRWVPPTEGFVYHALVGYRLDGKTVTDSGLRNLGSLFLAYVQRDGKQIGAVGPHYVVRNGDLLGFAGTTDNFAAFCDSKNLTSLDDVLVQGVEAFASHFHIFSLVEPALVRSKSGLIGKTAKEVSFRSRYNASIISVSRSGATFSSASWGRIKFQAFDSLMLLKGDKFDWNDSVTARDLRAPPSPFKAMEGGGGWSEAGEAKYPTF